jgi:DNA-binding NarL/FixJ family response regulator
VSRNGQGRGEAHGRIAVALAIDDVVLRARALRALEHAPERLVAAMGEESADVLLADHLLRSHQRASAVPVLLVAEKTIIDEGLRQGYCGGVLPSFSDEKLKVAIEAAALGLICTEPGAQRGSALDDDRDEDPAPPALTVREAEVLQHLVSGASNKEIARRLDISVHTAKFHVASIVSKLGATGRTDAVARALRLTRAMI